ncbi:TPA: helix-turn-helix domain-containing protein [Escherichia coli]|nr:helix-turn-helix domain-containing protein [Escherichia coli]
MAVGQVDVHLIGFVAPTVEQRTGPERILEAGESRQRIALIFDVGVSTIYRNFPANENNESP